MVHTWKPRKQAFWPSPECRKPFRMLPRHALSRHAGVGPWRAATAEIQIPLPTPAQHAKLFFTRQTSNVLSTCHWQILQAITSRASRLPNHAPCSARAPRIELSFSRPKLSDYFLDPRPAPPDPPRNAPNIMSNRRCGWGKPRGHFLRTPFWQAFPGEILALHPGRPPAQSDYA